MSRYIHSPAGQKDNNVTEVYIRTKCPGTYTHPLDKRTTILLRLLVQNYTSFQDICNAETVFLHKVLEENTLYSDIGGLSVRENICGRSYLWEKLNQRAYNTFRSMTDLYLPISRGD